MTVDLTNNLPFASNIAMFHIGRTGSLVLSTMLKQILQISWAHEVFRPDLRKRHFEEFSTQDPADVLRNIMVQSKRVKPGSTYFGFESQLPQVASLGLGLDAYIGILQELNFRHIIVLKHRNHLRRIVSSLLGHMTSRWYSKVDEKIPVIRFHMDIHAFWTGDVWKIVPCLNTLRPDLSINVVPCFPSGLAFVSKLDSKSSLLSRNQKEIVEQFSLLSYEHLKNERHSMLNTILNAWTEIVGYLPEAPVDCP
jgi:hypothetical protein